VRLSRVIFSNLCIGITHLVSRLVKSLWRWPGQGARGPERRMSFPSTLLRSGRALRSVSSPAKRLHTVAAATPEYDECDIVIVGGGPAGLALANALGGYRTVSCLLIITRAELISDKALQDQ
jgi:hypothetical protein